MKSCMQAKYEIVFERDGIRNYEHTYIQYLYNNILWILPANYHCLETSFLDNLLVSMNAGIVLLTIVDPQNLIRKIFP